MNELWLSVYGIACVLVTIWWCEHLDKRAALKLARAECERFGHKFGEPFGSEHGQHRNCMRCNKQQHWHRITEEWK